MITFEQSRESYNAASEALLCAVDASARLSAARTMLSSLRSMYRLSGHSKGGAIMARRDVRESSPNAASS